MKPLYKTFNNKQCIQYIELHSCPNDPFLFSILCKTLINFVCIGNASGEKILLLAKIHQQQDMVNNKTKLETQIFQTQVILVHSRDALAD